MPVGVKKSHPALKHGGYAATTILPGESEAEFEKLHRDLIAHFSPNGALENDTVATMARLLWRKQNSNTLRIAEFARRRLEQLVDIAILGAAQHRQRTAIGEIPGIDLAAMR